VVPVPRGPDSRDRGLRHGTGSGGSLQSQGPAQHTQAQGILARPRAPERGTISGQAPVKEGKSQAEGVGQVPRHAGSGGGGAQGAQEQGDSGEGRSAVAIGRGTTFLLAQERGGFRLKTSWERGRQGRGDSSPDCRGDARFGCAAVQVGGPRGWDLQGQEQAQGVATQRRAALIRRAETPSDGPAAAPGPLPPSGAQRGAEGAGRRAGSGRAEGGQVQGEAKGEASEKGQGEEPGRGKGEEEEAEEEEEEEEEEWDAVAAAFLRRVREEESRRSPQHRASGDGGDGDGAVRT